MTITDVKIRRVYPVSENSPLRALVSITIDGDLAVHDIKVIQGDDRLFVAMPSWRDNMHRVRFRDVAHPIGTEAREQLEHVILSAYDAYCAARE